MKEFEYQIKAETGLHARPAGLLVSLSKLMEGTVTIEKEGKAVDATRLFAVMGLGVRCGDTIRVRVEGGEEEKSIETLRAFFKENV